MESRSQQLLDLVTITQRWKAENPELAQALDLFHVTLEHYSVSLQLLYPSSTYLSNTSMQEVLQWVPG